MARVTLALTVDDTIMILIDGLQWGGDRDRSGAGNATFSTVAEAVEAFRMCGNRERIEGGDVLPHDIPEETD